MNLSTPDLVDLVRRNSRTVAFPLVEPLGRFLTTASALFDGDLEEVVIMVAVSLRSSQHPDFRQLDDSDLASRVALPGFGTNMRSLAASTGIARETVRRKVASLIERGFLVSHHGIIYYTAAAYRLVEPARDALIKLHVRGFEVVGSLRPGS